MIQSISIKPNRVLILKSQIDAMKDEMKSMKANDVWDLIELPEGPKSISCKWIFKTKSDSKGNVEKYNDRLVSKGFTQKEGIDYKKIFSPISSKDSFTTIMVLVANFDLELHQMDIKTTFSMVKLTKQYIWYNKKIVSGDAKKMAYRYIKIAIGVSLGYHKRAISKRILNRFGMKDCGLGDTRIDKKRQVMSQPMLQE
ncbi:cysteine-rich RLK (RECEPTOR-like protein kinase) 8 [Abeliophyllum distichum]|uniref:Cysteine-rich RLK (RECEPTOR-like protein kinase) 8 n=1 Tax=Abeliophyllum distichum TaxID=126358 RepID=A0ABD1SAI6_9LAMI